MKKGLMRLCCLGSYTLFFQGFISYFSSVIHYSGSLKIKVPEFLRQKVVSCIDSIIITMDDCPSMLVLLEKWEKAIIINNG